MMYASQMIMLDPLNVYSALGQLYLNKTGRNKKKLLILLVLPVLLDYFFIKDPFYR